MCGRFQIKRSPKTEALLKTLNVSGEPRYSDDCAPGSLISFIHENGARQLDTAIWWLFLDPHTLKPNYKYTSFNCRWDKLNQSRSISYQPFRETRCIIPATALCEGLGDKKTYHMVELEDKAIAFGGLYRPHVNRQTGEIVHSAAIITLPPVEKWANIHPKSIPLMLDYEDTELIDKWLDPEFSDVEAFNDLLEPAIHQAQRVTPIDRPSKWNPIGESFLIS